MARGIKNDRKREFIEDVQERVMEQSEQIGSIRTKLENGNLEEIDEGELPSLEIEEELRF